jgi:3'5'-cyclic nucleotide phosphodiesterase
MSVKKVALRRASMQTAVNKASENVYLSENASKGLTVLDVVTHAVKLPNFDPELVMEAVDPSAVEIDNKVQKQLKQFIQVIAGTYLPNPFHNYEHAVHVQMSTMKLLSRVTSPEHIDFNGDCTTVASDAHDYTYGITSDPLTQFCVVFAGLCHDCAHTGVPNSQLVKEKANVARIYGNKSVAEQNSVDLAWSLLMNSDYADLRQCIYSNESEFRRFRQLMVNLIIATDLFDRQLNQLQMKRWEIAFNGNTNFADPSEEVNRKATIVVEYLIQASDIAHTMQHWKIYKKWNERLFREMYCAFDVGRNETDPSIGWYKGELWFFDNYVIPLAKKLKECRVFGVSSDECLNYATENRATWASEGEKIVSEWLAAVSN